MADNNPYPYKQITVPHFKRCVFSLVGIGRDLLFARKYQQVADQPSYAYAGDPWDTKVALLKLQDYKAHINQNALPQNLEWNEVKHFIQVLTLNQAERSDVGFWSFKWPKRDGGLYKLLIDEAMCAGILAMTNEYLYLDPISNEFTKPEIANKEQVQLTSISAMPILPLFSQVVEANPYNITYYASVWCVYELLGGTIRNIEANQMSLEHGMYEAIAAVGRIICAHNIIQTTEDDRGAQFFDALSLLDQLCFGRKVPQVPVANNGEKPKPEVEMWTWGFERELIEREYADTYFSELLSLPSAQEQTRFLKEEFYDRDGLNIKIRFLADYTGNDKHMWMDLSAITAGVIDMCYTALIMTAERSGHQDAKGAAELLDLLFDKLMGAELWTTADGYTGSTLKDFLYAEKEQLVAA